MTQAGGSATLTHRPRRAGAGVVAVVGKIVERFYGQRVDQPLSGPGQAWRLDAAEVDGAEGLRRWLAGSPPDRVLVRVVEIGLRLVVLFRTGRRVAMAHEELALANLEEPLRDLAALCEGLRALCRHGEAAALAPLDLEPLAATAAHLAGQLVRRIGALVTDGQEQTP